MKISRLSREVMKENIERLLELEQYYSEDPNELWNRDGFLMEVEGKFDLSRIAFESNQVAGYVVISIKREGNRYFGYVNKTFVNPKNRNSSVYVRLFLSAKTDLKKLKIDTLRWKCSPENERVYEYHLSFADEVIGEEVHHEKRYYIFQKKIKIT